MQQKSANPQTVPARLNVYTMMLVMAFIAMCAACVMLYLELSSYGEFMKWWDTSGSQPSVMAPLTDMARAWM